MSSRPISPHLQIYRPQLTSVLSILHRATGVFLSVGTPVLLYWLLAAAAGAEAYATAQTLLDAGFVQLLLVAWSWAFYYHLCNGVRHLCWDAGYGFELSSVYASGYAVLGASLILTLLTWACVWSQGTSA